MNDITGLELQIETMTKIASAREAQFTKCREARQRLYFMLEDLHYAQERFDMSLASAGADGPGTSEYRAAQAYLKARMEQTAALLKEVSP